MKKTMMRWMCLTVLAVLLSGSMGCAQIEAGRKISGDPAVREARALAGRLLGGRSEAFEFERIDADNGKDVFELESDRGRIIIRGNKALAMTSGLNWYLSQYCQCQVSLNYNRISLPDELPVIPQKVRQVTPWAYRNFFNYCTFGYTMPWWDWERWERMIDYMALYGVNMPLAITGQEAVWQAVFEDMGLSQKQIEAFLVGPAYLPWGWMGNIDGLGGPLPQGWIDRQKRLQQRILARERALGMTPVLQGFAGHVPAAIKEKYPQAKVHQTTDWACMPGVYFLDPMDPLFKEIGTRFIEKQTEFYGSDHLYNADCFNEVNPPTNDTQFIARIGKSVYETMTAADPQAVWVFQGWFLYWQRDFWQKPQAAALLGAVPHDRMIGLDLYCERNPVWDKTEAFYGKQWVWNVICNLGQKVNLSGDLQIMEDNLQKARVDPRADQLVGLGVMMEGFGYNPVVQEFILSKVWSPERVDLETWIQDYACRRYGTNDSRVKEAWRLLLKGPYSRNILGESNICYTPGLSGKRPPKRSGIGDGQYDPRTIDRALKLLLDCADSLGGVSTYRFDVVNLTRAMLSNHAVGLTDAMNQAYADKDAKALRAAGDAYLALIYDMDTICGTNENFMLGKWVGDARKLAGNDAERELYDLNARAILTMWQPAKSSCLRDYASRQWSGLLKDFYAVRWSRYLEGLCQALEQGKRFDYGGYVNQIKEFELEWIHQHQHLYPTQPSGDTVQTARELLAHYALADVQREELAHRLGLVPWPQAVKERPGRVVFKPVIRFEDSAYKPLAEVLRNGIASLTQVDCQLGGTSGDAGIVMAADRTLGEEAYTLTIKNNVVYLRGGDYAGLVHSTATLLQLLAVKAGTLEMPRVTIQDRAAYPFRSVMLDLARHWQPIETLKETVDLAYMYKYNALHLHLSDDQSFTFPSERFPGLKSYFSDGRARHYTRAQLKDLVEYARVRGIVVIPEIDVPGHSSSLTRGAPEAFGTVDPKTGKVKSTGSVVNMASEKTYESLDTLIGELCEVFTTSPYIHIGADEVAPGFLARLPEYAEYVKKHGLRRAQDGDTGELYSHFVVRMNEIVKKHGKTMMAWEGFHGNGTPDARIPNDIIVMVWNMGYNPPQQLLDNGFTIINCGWRPLYIVPTQNYMDSHSLSYAWDIHEFAHRRTGVSIMRMADDAAIMGAQICFWEQTYDAVIPSLREHMPVIAERIWNSETGLMVPLKNRPSLQAFLLPTDRHSEKPGISPHRRESSFPARGKQSSHSSLKRLEAPLSFESFESRYVLADKQVGYLIRPVSIVMEGLLPDSGQTISFDREVMVSLTSHIPGVIRYRVDKDWGGVLDNSGEVYSGPFRLAESAVVTAGVYDDEGHLLAPCTQQGCWKIDPAYTYRVFGPVPEGGWPKMPDFSTLKELRSGIIGHTNQERLSQLNYGMFSRHPALGHIDTQPYRQFNPFALELTGQLRIEKDGEYSFKISSPFGMGRMWLGDTQAVASLRIGGKGAQASGYLKAGVYPLRIEYFYTMILNQLNIQMKAEPDGSWQSLDDFVLSLDEWKPKDQLKHVAEGVVFADEARKKLFNLATHKPVTCSGGYQGGHVPENAVDADPSNDSGWHCGSSGQWLQVDLEKLYTIDRIKLYTYYDGQRHYRYTIEVSTDGKSYQQVVDQSGNTMPSSAEGFEHLFDAVQARYVRVNMLYNSANPGVHINELMVFAVKGSGR